MIDLFLQNNPDIKLYEKSVIEDGGAIFFMISDGLRKFLVIQSGTGTLVQEMFHGEMLEIGGNNFLKSPLSAENAAALRERFAFSRPVLIGKMNSYGLGDRLGNAGAAHLKAIRKTTFMPVLAQQSIRELQRTGRTAQEVIDAATWAVFREGYRDGYGADGDHLKTPEDIDLMADAGYTMFTIDPSEFVVNEAIHMNRSELETELEKLPWDDLGNTPDIFKDQYFGLKAELADGFVLSPSEPEILAGMVKYGRVITHTKMMSDYLHQSYPDHPAELELSVDETDQPTTVFEHYLVASELNRLNVELVSLAPRFCGDFEKGIDFKGDLEQFKKEYRQHLAIAEKFGGYKLSIHSGSDKFSVYEAIGSLNKGAVHVKTAGTSYLEALRSVAEADPPLFREILDYSKSRFETDKKTYHISCDLRKVPDGKAMPDHELKKLLDDDNVRQVLHVTFGSVLNGPERDINRFKERLMECLNRNEQLYENNLETHFDRHLEPFIKTDL
ncbi:MAG: hypothetical protein EA359_14845 [Balneolaceae bacterium]|nr:MAG: hypothetical protein EA359_14845 [Balneolaceae bacterium]